VISNFDLHDQQETKFECPLVSLFKGLSFVTELVCPPFWLGNFIYIHDVYFSWNLFFNSGCLKWSVWVSNSLQWFNRLFANATRPLQTIARSFVNRIVQDLISLSVENFWVFCTTFQIPLVVLLSFNPSRATYELSRLEALSCLLLMYLVFQKIKKERGSVSVNSYRVNTLTEIGSFKKKRPA